MNARWTVLLAAFTVVFLAGTVLATAAEPNSGQNRSAVQGSGGIQVSTLMGTTVLNPQSQKLGLIKDVLLDAQTGQVTFVILDEEIPGAGHAMLVVPYEALRLSVNPSDKRQTVVLDLRLDQMRAAPQTQSTNRRYSRIRSFWNKPATFIKPGRTPRHARLTTRPCRARRSRVSCLSRAWILGTPILDGRRSWKSLARNENRRQ